MQLDCILLHYCTLDYITVEPIYVVFNSFELYLTNGNSHNAVETFKRELQWCHLPSLLNQLSPECHFNPKTLSLPVLIVQHKYPFDLQSSVNSIEPRETRWLKAEPHFGLSFCSVDKSTRAKEGTKRPELCFSAKVLLYIFSREKNKLHFQNILWLFVKDLLCSFVISAHWVLNFSKYAEMKMKQV